MPHVLVIGGGPAGLRAAEVASAAGAEVTLCDQMRSAGRKFLVAGKGGLNLTHSEELEVFEKRYEGRGQPEGFWRRALEGFDNRAIRGWAARLEVGTFVQRSGRVYPKALKAAPLLRRWVQRLKQQGVDFQMQHRLVGLSGTGATFETSAGERRIEADVVVLALGGASWPQTGSDGRWVECLEAMGVKVDALEAANCGWEIEWPEGLGERVEGQPLKNVVASVGEKRVPGEMMLTGYGIEGGPIYALGPDLRGMEAACVTLDFKPDFTVERLVAKMESARRDFLQESATRWKLSEPMRVLLEGFAGPFESARELAEVAKAFRLPLKHPRPVEEAISSAGGVVWDALDEGLMIEAVPGVFVAGEMISWEAPTGGYLLQGCFASGTMAAEAALRWSSR